MWNNKKVSVVLGTYREKNSIRKVIDDFFLTGYVDEVVVVDNNAEAGTVEEVRKTKARIVHELRQGYGYSFQRGIREATGDCVLLCDPDGTFVAADIEKFLAYAKDFPVVFGTRTNENNIHMGAEMGFLRKCINIIEAKIVQVLFGASSLTDVGCTYKLFSRDAIKQLSGIWHEDSYLFCPELLLLVISQKIKFIEIPVIYKARIGKSAMTANLFQLVRLEIHVFIFLFSFWMHWVLGYPSFNSGNFKND